MIDISVSAKIQSGKIKEMPLLYQRHFGKGTIVSLYCCFSGHQEGTKHHISLEAHKKTRTALQQNSSQKRLWLFVTE